MDFTIGAFDYFYLLTLNSFIFIIFNAQLIILTQQFNSKIIVHLISKPIVGLPTRYCVNLKKTKQILRRYLKRSAELVRTSCGVHNKALRNFIKLKSAPPVSPHLMQIILSNTVLSAS